MSKNGEKCRSVPPGAWDDILECLVLSTTKKIRSLLSERSKIKVKWKLFKRWRLSKQLAIIETRGSDIFYWANEPEKMEARGTRIRHADPSQVEIIPFIYGPREDKKKKKTQNLLSDMSGTHMLSMFRLVMKNSVLLKAPSVLWLERRPIDRQWCSSFSLTNQACAFKDRRKQHAGFSVLGWIFPFRYFWLFPGKFIWLPHPHPTY